MIISFDHSQEVLNQMPNYFMRNIVNFLVLFRRLLQNELYEFAGRGLDQEKIGVIVILVMIVLEGVFLVDLRLDGVEGDISNTCPPLVTQYPAYYSSKDFLQGFSPRLSTPVYP